MNTLIEFYDPIRVFIFGMISKVIGRVYGQAEDKRLRTTL
jgi:hypothetical protein